MADPGFGLKISPGVVLRNLLQQYPSGGQFFLEALQNADDTGRAGNFCALLDMRRHPTTKIRQPVAARAVLQNEAILFYDNAGFKDRDWRSLQFMCDSIKRTSPHESGAFGMGSRSFFHITDVLQVLSGNRFSMLDPDDILDTGHFGEQIDFTTDGFLDKYPDEGAPFLGVFGCDVRTPFKGSIIRASLRTEERASKCTFMPQAFELSRAKRIFTEFEETLKNGEVLLFLNSVRSVELWRWDVDAKEPTQLARATLGVSSGHKLPRKMSGPSEVKAFLQNFNTFVELEAAMLKPDANPPDILDVVEMESTHLSTGVVTKRKWLRAGCFTKNAEILRLVASCNCVPMVTLALPIGQAVEGCLFASLPLPLPSGLPVHLNAYFRLYDNRRNIWRTRVDLDGEHRLWGQWNDRILSNMVPDVYSRALELLASMKDLSDDYGHSVWPKEADVPKEYSAILDPLVQWLRDMAVLPTPTGTLAKPSESLFFLTPSTALQAVRDQLLHVCTNRGLTVVDPPEHVVSLLHNRKALTQKPCAWVLSDVIIPAAPTLEEKQRATLLLAFLEWVGTWKEPEVKELAKQLADVKWIPTADCSARTINDCFDPAQSPEALFIVKERRAKLEPFITEQGLNADTVWRVLRLCGLKTEITWENAVEEAERSVRDSDVERASLLFAHVNKRHSSLRGGRVGAIKQLQTLAWAPAVEANVDAAPEKASKLLVLKDVFPTAGKKLVWAVAPTLFMEPAIQELAPGRAVEAEPGILVEQIKALSVKTASTGTVPPRASKATLGHLHTAFGALLPLLSKLPTFADQIKDLAFVPCMNVDGSEDGAELFTPPCATFTAKHGHKDLSPMIGVVKAKDKTIQMIAESAGVTKEPRAEVISQFLGKAGTEAPKATLAVTLAVELAVRLRAKSARPPSIAVPTVFGTIEDIGKVYVDDAPWRKNRQIICLEASISHEDGHMLGCASLRDKMARDCEEDAVLKGKDPFGERADLASQARQLLQEFGDSADLVAEFVQHCDAIGVNALSIHLSEDTFGGDSVLDPRAAALQGPALYICLDKALSAEEITRMQRVGDSKTALEFGTSGRTGVGLNVMYRYSDCPQVLSDKRLHFFDLMRKFVSKPDGKRGRLFAVGQIEEHFPDCHAPFGAKPVAGKYPTVFRLALRKTNSDLGLTVKIEDVRSELQKAAAVADKLLLFTQHVRRLDFHDGAKVIATHEASVKDAGPYGAFFKGLPKSPSELKAGDMKSCLTHKTIVSGQDGSSASAEWAIAHCVGVSKEDMLKAVKEQPKDAPQLPQGAAAMKLSLSEEEKLGGKICCGSITSFRSSTSAWLHGNFAFPSSRKSMPLPDEKEAKPTLDKTWNRMLLEGPVTASLRALTIYCTDLVLKKGLDIHRYVGLFPSRGDRHQTILATAAFSLDWILSDVIIPQATKFGEVPLAGMLLGFLEWAGSWKEAEIKELSKKLLEVKWIPSEDGAQRPIKDSFEPVQSPGQFCVVKARRTKFGDLMKEAGLNEETVWRVLSLCGMKKDLTWEDAVEEAGTIVKDEDVERAKLLFEHLNQRQGSLSGNRAASLQKLKDLAWAPANEPSASTEPEGTKKLRLLKDVFPPAATNLVWAVAPSLCVESAIAELKPGHTIEAEPGILVEQVRAIADAVAKSSGKSTPMASGSTLDHLRAVFAAVLPVLSKLPGFDKNPKLKDVAFIPCAPSKGSGEGAELFAPRCAAFEAKHDSKALSPMIGLVLPKDQPIKMIAEAAGVPKEPRAEVLAEILNKPEAATFDSKLAVALAVELASRIRAKEERPLQIQVPIAQGGVEDVEKVFIDDAPWRPEEAIITLHPDISADDGLLLGCSSLCEAMARQCEEEARKEAEEEAMRQAAEEAAKKKAAEAESAKRKAEEEERAAKRRKIEAEEEAKRKAEEEERAKQKAEEELARKKAEEEEAARKKKAEEEEAARQKKEEEEAKKKAEEEAAAKKKAEEEAAAKKKAEEEEAAKVKAREEEIAKLEGKKKEEEMAKLKKEQEEAAAKKKKEEEEAAKKREAEEKKAAEEKAAKEKAEKEAAAKKKAEEEAAAKKKAEEEKAAKLKAEKEEAARKKALEEAARKKAEEEKAAKLQAEKEEAERKKKEAEEEKKRQAELEVAKKKAREEAAAAAKKEMQEDPLGQEADLVSNVRQLLQEYGDGADFVTEFVQYFDDLGASSVTILLREEPFGVERVMDPRLKTLQGPALYVCCGQQISEADIARAQCVGKARRRLNFGSQAGASGAQKFDSVGLNVMYRYCDCPQLVANGRLHFMDIGRSFVSRPGVRRGRQFKMDLLKNKFPDSWKPFDTIEKDLGAAFPTIFRLTLRTEKSEMGLKVDLPSVRDELQKAALSADKALLFTRSLSKLEFRDGATLISTCDASLKDPAAHKAFWENLPCHPKDITSETFRSCIANKIISTKTSESSSKAEWVVAHRLSNAGNERAQVIKEQYEQKDTTPMLPLGAAAVRVEPVEEEAQGGKVCCGFPTTFRTNSCVWVHANFALPSSRKSLPVPEEKEAKPSLDKRWNTMLLEGPVTDCIRALAATCTELVLKKSIDVHRYFSLFPSRGDRIQTTLAVSSFNMDWLLSEVVMPLAKQSCTTGLAAMLLAFLEWAGSWKEAEIKELGKKLATVQWVPSEDGSARTIANSFDPAKSPEQFSVVKQSRAKIGGLLEEWGLNAETVWRVLKICGLKQEMTWQDTADEAEALVRDSDVARAKMLFEHLNKQHSSLQGERAPALKRLQALPWVPVKEPCVDTEPQDATALKALKDAFPVSATRLVWAVAPSLCMEPTVKELMPGRTLEKEPEILVEQLRALAQSASKDMDGLPVASDQLLEQLCTTFGAMLPRLTKLGKLDEHPRLKDVPFVPCQPADESVDGAVLFMPRCSAFRAMQAHRALSPVIGIVKPSHQNIRLISEAANVTKEPRAEVLAEALCKPGEDSDSLDQDLAVALAIELAARLRAKEARPARIFCPTVFGTVKGIDNVYIDDAPWRQQARDIVTLHPRISADDGRLLGCTSLREELTRQCEDGSEDNGKEDTFGQEADLVSQVKQLLLEYGEEADLVKEFVQNADDAGTKHMAFYIIDEQFPTDRVVDQRTVAIQGPALYVCSDKKLTEHDINRMQTVGASQKRMDFSSSGRFGVGMNVMYRYSDCPQLLANDRLHFFDLTRNFVAKPGTKRGRQFTVEKVTEHFPDSLAPFEVPGIVGVYPTVFRLALRKERSEMALKIDLDDARVELRRSSEIADKMLLFARHLRRMDFYDGQKLIASFGAAVKEEDRYDAFFKSLPPTPLELKPGHMDLFLAQKEISRETPEGKSSSDWAIAHRVGVPTQAMLKVLKDQYEQPHGVALLPHGASAVKIKTDAEDVREGRICCGPPTIFKTNSCAWIHGSFALLSSRKTLPLPEGDDPKPSLDKQWNKMLLEGPIAESMRGLILHCSALVLFQSMTIERYVNLFPIRGDTLASILAIATFKKSMADAVFPVRKDDRVTFEHGPTPTFHSDELHGDIQNALVLDGLKLVSLPPEVVAEYEDALGKPRKQLDGLELCTFLKEAFAKLKPEIVAAEKRAKLLENNPVGGNTRSVEEALREEFPNIDYDLDSAAMHCLKNKDFVLSLLSFAMNGCWKAYCDSQKGIGRMEKVLTFKAEQLRGVPLLLTHAQQVTTFGLITKYSSFRDILPTKRELFIDRDAHSVAVEAVDVNVEGVKNILATGAVDCEIPGVRKLQLHDLFPYRQEVEASIIPTKGFMYSGNEPLRLFWSLVADRYAESLQVSVDPFANLKRHIVGCESAPSTILKKDISWSREIQEWRVLPICSKVGGGEEGENCVAIGAATTCVAVTLVATDNAVVESLTGILQDCDVDTIQHDAMSDDRIARLIRTLCVCENESLLQLLVNKGNFEPLTALQRHDLLAYFSMLCVKGGVNLADVKKLPVFKTCASDGKFIAMQEKMRYVCIDPQDKHAEALSTLNPPGLVMLAWPTQQVKPIYEYCNVQLLNGEDFMVTSVIPQLAKIVEGDKDGLISFPFLAELHAYCCLDNSDKVIRVAAEAPFVPSEDYSRMGMPREFTSPAGSCAKAFIELLSSYLPVLWMQQNLQHMELLHALGMEASLSSHQILLCAADLDQAASRAIIDADSECTALSLGGQSDARSLRQKSFELVEEFARAAEEVWPKRKPEVTQSGIMLTDGSAEPPRVEDMTNLIKAAMMRILIARRHRTDQTKKKEGHERNGKKLKDLKGSKESNEVEQYKMHYAELELVPLYGCAFKEAKQVLWSSCPLEDHRSRPGANDSIHFKNLIDFHSRGVFKVFGCYVLEEQAPPELVMQHLATICKLQQTDPGEASVKTDSLLHEDIRACWKHLSDAVTVANPEDAGEEYHKALARLRGLPCCAVQLEDVSDKKVEVTNFTIPRHAFFQLPILKGKEANLRLYLRQVLAETSKEAQLFRFLGATDRPRAGDFAGASERVAAKAEELGRANWEWVVVCLDACVRGVYEDLSDMSTKKDENTALELSNLHLFTMEGSIMRVGSLVWADEPRYHKRCENGQVLRFCALNQGNDERKIADVLVKHAGLRQLSGLVEERRVVDADGDTEVDKEFKDTVVRLVRSSEFSCGLHAVILNNNKGAERVATATIADLTRDLQQIVFKSIRNTLRSALYWKDKEKLGSGPIQGSEQEQEVYYDETDKSIYIGEVQFGPNEDMFTAELVFSLRRALPLLWNVDNFLLEAMLRCALTHGVAGISPFLEKRDIKVDILAPRHLGPGDLLPQDLQDHLEWQMEATFGEGETVAVMASNNFTIAEVSKWPDEQSVGEGLNRSYLVRISADSFEARKHFEVYKIRNKTTVEESTELVAVGSEESKDKINVDVNEDSIPQDKEDAKAIADIKQYLHEMAKMQPSDYKAVMRRLFKTWHPDKVGGDTPTAARIFHLLRTHEQWFKKKQAGEVFGDDSWLDNDDDIENMNRSGSKDGELLALPSTEPIPTAADSKADTSGGSWFTEFEREMQEARADQESKKHGEDGERKNRFSSMGGDDKDNEVSKEDMLKAAPMAAEQTEKDNPTEVPEDFTPSSRVVDKQLAPRYLKEAKLEVVAARRMMVKAEGLAELASRAVWHCQQGVEMALRAAMLRTCGIADDEAIGGAAHDLIDFVSRLRSAEVNTEEQRRAQSEVPLSEEDVKWFKHAYLAARYPKPGRYGVPGLLYNDSDATRALGLAEEMITWSSRVEDLPDPSKFRRRRWTLDKDDAKAMLEEEKKKQAKVVGPPAASFTQDGYMVQEPAAKAMKPTPVNLDDGLFAPKKVTGQVVAPPGKSNGQGEKRPAADAGAGMEAKKTKRWGSGSVA